jgi:predicted protein tyrosine phosphatase
MILVCPLSHLQQSVDDSGARHVVTLVRDEMRVFRPQGIEPENHLWLQMDDITEPLDGYIAPAAEHVEALLGFVERWRREQPLIIHCFAGISRSTAAAFIALCAVNPRRTEADIAERLRAASPTATPNARIVAFGDEILGRQGRMSAAIQSIGRGAMAVEGMPFAIPVRD